jgi:hypothetical protein
MNGVYGSLVGRLDVRLVRGDSSRLGVRWRRRHPDGSVTAVDLSGWSGVVELRSPSGELWWSVRCAMDADGFAVASIPPGLLSAPQWDGRRSGSWKCVAASPDGTRVRTLAWGYVLITD